MAWTQAGWAADSVSFGAIHHWLTDPLNPRTDTVGSVNLSQIGTAPTSSFNLATGNTSWNFGVVGSLVSAAGTMPTGTTTISVEIWVLGSNMGTPSQTRSAVQIVGTSNDNTAGIQFAGNSQPNGTATFRRAGVNEFDAPPTLNDGHWHQVVGSAGPTHGRRLFVDGLLRNTWTPMLTAVGSPGIRIGSNGFIPGTENSGQRWPGWLTNCAVYSTELTELQVWRLWHGPDASARSGFFAGLPMG